MNIHQFPPSRRLSVAKAQAGAHAVTAVESADQLRRTYCASEAQQRREFVPRGVDQQGRLTPTIPPAAMDSAEGCPGDDQPAEVFAINSMRFFRQHRRWLGVAFCVSPFAVIVGVAAWAALA